MQTTTALELYDQMLKLYADWGNRGALWSSVSCHKSLIRTVRCRRLCGLTQTYKVELVS